MKFRILIITSALCIKTVLYAQLNVPISDKGFPSPNAAALGKYADYPVQPFTGVPSINIPLYTLKDGEATLPIFMSYHASGIKVAEVASWVGIGWALNAGGVITRNIRGLPDEGTKKTGGTLGSKGYYKDYGLSTFPPVGLVSGSEYKLGKVIDEMVYKGTVDGESDLYTFNINGIIVGKFIFDEKRNPTFLTRSDIKIVVEYSTGEFQRWIITTSDGAQYIFGENNAKESNGVSGSTDADNNAPTSWYLTKIIYPKTTDTISFEYIPENYTYLGLTSELTIAFDTTNLASKVPNGSYLRYDFKGLLLNKIKSKNIEIDFTANTIRKDVDNLGHALDKIQIKNRATYNLIDEIRFGYNYFVSTINGSLELGTTSITDTWRLKLISIQKGIESALLQMPPYTFEYYEDVKLPRRCSYDVDHWGYANDFGGHNNRFTPNTKADFKITKLTVTPPMGGQYREPRWPYTQAFTLKKIKDPLGINTTFEFEANIIIKDNIKGNTVGGGIRTKYIAVDGYSTPVQKNIRRFDYSIDSIKTSGVILRKPGYWGEIANEYKPTGGWLSYSNFVGDLATINDATFSTFYKFSQSPLPLQDYQGYAVGYKEVKEVFGENGENGYKVYSYQVNPNSTSTTRLKSSNYAPGGIPNRKFNEILPDSLKYSDATKRGRFFPIEPEQVDLNTGLLLKEQVFDKNGKLLIGREYNYEQKYYYNQWLRGFINGGIKVMFDRSIPPNSYPIYPITYYSYRTGTVSLLSQKTTAIDTLTGKNAITEVKYAYESPNHLQPTRQTTTNSIGDTLENVMRYSFDFDSTAISGGVISEMKKQNILTPLRTETWRNNTLMGFTSTEYAKNTIGSKTVVLPTKTYTTESKKAISSADIGFNKSFANNIKSLTGTSSYVKQQGLYSYNDAGLLQQQSANNTSTAYIWDYKNTIPVAVATNAMPTDIAYTSFEADGTGNWTMGSTNRIKTEAFTGTQCYDLSKGNITKTGLNSSKTYWLNYWAKTGASVSVTNTAETKQGVTQNNWTLWTKKITGTTNITISGTGSIDELRIHPDKSQMKSSTYIVGIGMSSQVDANNNVTLYEYDELNRLKLMRDGNRNILKTYCYNYAGKPISCDGVLFYNTADSLVFRKNNCSPGYIGSYVTYTVPANKYSSIISRWDADNKAKIDINTNGQFYANAHGKCFKLFAEISYTNTNVNGTEVYADVMVTFSIPATYSADSSTILSWESVYVDNVPIQIRNTYNRDGGSSSFIDRFTVSDKYDEYAYIYKQYLISYEVEIYDERGDPTGSHTTATTDFTVESIGF